TLDGDIYVIIDADCEDPPEMIETFVSAYEEGYDIAYGERVDRAEPRLLKRARHFFYRLMRAVADDEVLLDMAEVSLITREVRDAVVADRTSFPFIRASIGASGSDAAAFPTSGSRGSRVIRTTTCSRWLRSASRASSPPRHGSCGWRSICSRSGWRSRRC